MQALLLTYVPDAKFYVVVLYSLWAMTFIKDILSDHKNGIPVEISHKIKFFQKFKMTGFWRDMYNTLSDAKFYEFVMNI